MRGGGLVAIPTETVYGLAADAANAEAIARVFAAKGRPRFNPLIVHVADLAAAERLGVFSETARALAERFWPGPLSIVVEKRAGAPVADLATAGLNTIALRAPAHGAAQAVIAACGLPLAAPSANASGGLSPTTAAHAAAEIGDNADLILDGGACASGVESTVIAVAGGRATLLRPGAIPREEIETITGALAEPPRGDAKRSPGLMARHYAPKRARLRLNADAATPGEAFLGFGPSPWATINLSPSADPAEAAARLFAALRALDDAGYARIAVAPIPDAGLGLAINDRLARAAENFRQSEAESA